MRPEPDPTAWCLSERTLIPRPIEGSQALASASPYSPTAEVSGSVLVFVENSEIAPPKSETPETYNLKTKRDIARQSTTLRRLPMRVGQAVRVPLGGGSVFNRSRADTSARPLIPFGSIRFIHPASRRAILEPQPVSPTPRQVPERSPKPKPRHSPLRPPLPPPPPPPSPTSPIVTSATITHSHAPGRDIHPHRAHVFAFGFAFL